MCESGRAPIGDVGPLGPGLKLQAVKIFAQPLKPLGGVIDGDDVGACGRQLSRFAARRGTKVDDGVATNIAQ